MGLAFVRMSGSIFMSRSYKHCDGVTVRRPLIAGNWKMNLNRADAVALARDIAAAETGSETDVLVCPATILLDSVSTAISSSGVALGGQDVYFEPNGAFTGETSTAMLTDIGCTYVILGHSERRHVIGETDELINKKIKAALAAGLTPILCVGELLAEREAGQTATVVESQFSGSLAGLTEEDVRKTVVAYEPVWAIGSGKTASPEQAQEVHADLRKLLAQRYNPNTSEAVRILYGGSVKPDNAADLLSRPDIDGALVGGASLKAESFLAIVNAANVSTAS
jgi:triosephosphate isomerase